MDSILDGLNAAQRSAVTSPSKVLQILAPPGSGKTKTLTSRVAYLLQHHGYKPWNIICLTFTIKSSREMKERISKILGNGIESRLILGTFHSVCRRYLVTYGHLIGIRKGFGIADGSDTTSIIKRIIKRLGLNMDPKKAQARISSSKSKGVHYARSAEQESRKRNVEQQEFHTVYEAYQSQLARSNLLDYDDLLLRCVDLLVRHPTCVSNVEVVLIDEFQDTNVVQFDLMRLFAVKNERVTTVGDPDQSIYGWRSAEIKNLKKMQKQYPDTRVIHLEDNYRSSGAILLAAREVIEQDESRPQKPLLPTHCPGTVPVLRRLPSAEIEAHWTATEIQRIIGLTGNLLVHSDFAILLRSASISRLLESALGKAGIPYRMIGGQRFFDRVEVKILLDYLRVVSQPNNNDAIVRIINVPSRGLGPATIKSLLEEAEIKSTTLWQVLRDAVQGNVLPKTKISKAAEQGLCSFTSIILNARKKLATLDNTPSPEDLLGFIIKRLDFQAYLKKTHADDHEARWANVEELVAQSAEYQLADSNGENENGETDALPLIEGLNYETANAAEEALSRFLANVALATELQREDGDTEGGHPRSQVTISTMHASKGLEWPVVFVPSAFEGCIPHSRAEDTDEERRLLYVAMTRAQALLYMSCPVKNSQREEATLSPFLSEKKVKRCLTNQGPSIDTRTIVDIARVLRRDFPAETDVLQMGDGLRSRNDDLWPLDGTDAVEAIQVRWSKWDGADSIRSDWHGSKRRRKMNEENVKSETTYATSIVGISTTMQSASSFSCPSTGFTTASAQLHRAQAEEENSRLRSADTPERHEQSGERNAKVRRNNQADLLSLWGMGGKNKPRSAEPSLNSAATEPIKILEPKSFNPTRTSVQSSCTIGSPLPQALGAHRLQPLRNDKVPPSRAPIDDDSARKQYVFLSSSPPPPEDVHGQAGVMENEQSPSMRDNIEEDDQADVYVQTTHDLGPAKTFHTTSITQSQANPASSKKTLGVRRSMTGWAARPKNTFSIPRLVGK